MLTPCQTLAATEGFAAVDKALFTTRKRFEKAKPVLCDVCPEDAKADCASRAGSIVTLSLGETIVVEPSGTFGGVFHG
jgi:hypothetical protein